MGAPASSSRSVAALAELPAAPRRAAGARRAAAALRAAIVPLTRVDDRARLPVRDGAAAPAACAVGALGVAAGCAAGTVVAATATAACVELGSETAVGCAGCGVADGRCGFDGFAALGLDGLAGLDELDRFEDAVLDVAGADADDDAARAAVASGADACGAAALPAAS